MADNFTGKLSRRKLVRNGAALAGGGMAAAAIAGRPSEQVPSTSVPASARAQFIFAEGVSADGSADAQPALQSLLDAVMGDTRPIILNGVYRLGAPLELRSGHQLMGSGTLRASHSGALLRGGERPVARVRIEGLRLEAEAPYVGCAIEGKAWQYARLENLRLLSAGGAFRTGIRFTDTAYWNTVRSLESDCTLDLFDLGDANNLVLDDINLCRYADIGIRSFLRFHAPCSGLVGRALSVEGVFKGQTLVKLDPQCTGIDLEFLRVEGRAGSSTSTFVDFNGARDNRLLVPQALFGLGGPALLNELENMVLVFSNSDSAAHRLGRGELVLPMSKSDPTEQGALSYNTERRRLRAMVDGTRSLPLSPAIEPLDMNGHDVVGVRGLTLQIGDLKATLTLDEGGRIVVQDERGKTSVLSLPSDQFGTNHGKSHG